MSFKHNIYTTNIIWFIQCTHVYPVYTRLPSVHVYTMYTRFHIQITVYTNLMHTIVSAKLSDEYVLIHCIIRFKYQYNTSGAYNICIIPPTMQHGTTACQYRIGPAELSTTLRIGGVELSTTLQNYRRDSGLVHNSYNRIIDDTSTVVMQNKSAVLHFLTVNEK